MVVKEQTGNENFPFHVVLSHLDDPHRVIVSDDVASDGDAVSDDCHDGDCDHFNMFILIITMYLKFTNAKFLNHLLVIDDFAT